MFRTEYSLQPTSQQCARGSSDLDTRRIVLLHHKQTPNTRTLRLMNTIGATETRVDAWSPALSNVATFSGFDLIIYEALSVAPAGIQSALLQVRTISKAPMIVLSLTRHPEFAMMALRAGADAVIPLTLHAEINAAHCHALLRRWQHSHSSPQVAIAAQMPH